MGFNDKIAAELSSLIYYQAEGKDVQLPGQWKKHSEKRDEDTGFVALLYIEEEGGGSGGNSAFIFMGTSSSAGSAIAQGQMKSNAELQEDPDHDMGIVRQASDFVKGGVSRLEDELGGAWQHATAGHSLGGAVASCMAVAFPDKISKCVTFESPGIIRYWREKAKSSKDEGHWKKHITEYVSFPNPINTCLPHIGTVYRLHMMAHSRSSPGHIIRCSVGSGLRFIVWVSLANAVAAATGHAHGFWAAKLGSVTVKLAQLLFKFKLTPSRAKTAFKESMSHDQASKDSRAAAKGEEVDDPGARPMLPILKLLPPQARPGFIVGFWAAVTAAAANTGYVSMRTIAQINDTCAEHDIDAIAEHFDDSGRPNGATEMESWPYLKEMLENKMPMVHFKRCIVEGMTPFHRTAYGLHNVRSREDVLARRACTMPGYVTSNPGG